LEEQGLLLVEDDVRKYIPELPDYGAIIQIQHLIHHTSGLRDFLELNGIAGHYSDELITPEDALSLICQQRELNFIPGEQYLYSNSGYFLLSQIVERVSGKTMRQFAKEKIFDPLGMVNTHFHDDRTEPVKNRAIGYHLDPKNGYRINVPGLESVGSGGIYSTVEDLALWDRNFYHNKLGQGNQKLMERILEPGVLNDGEVLDYAFGLTVMDYKGLRKVSHSGGYGGYSAEFTRFPDHALTVICLSNNSTLSAPTMALKVVDIFLQEYLKSEEETASIDNVEAVELDEKILARNAGYYVSDRGETVLKLVMREGKLGLEFRDAFFQLTPVSATHFWLLNAPLRAEVKFEVDGNDEIARVDFKRGKEPEALHKMKIRSISGEEIDRITGTYYSEELDTKARIYQEEDRVFLKIGYHTGELIAIQGARFIIEGDALSRSIVTVASDTDLIYFDLNSGRVRNLRFQKSSPTD
jgi:CubicO group peptidase (beta-lactamase class C family)